MSRDELRQIGVMVGSGGGSQDFTEEQYRLYYTGHLKQCSVYTIPTSTIGTLASEVSMRFGFRGLSHIVSTGCTSSTDAIGYAFRHIQAGVLKTIVAGGVDSPIAPLILRGFQLMRIMSTRWNHEPQRASRPFSRDRDGFVIAEGAWFFVLEEMEQARARGAHIYGEIAGYGSTCEAYHRVRLEECGEEPARAIGLALDEAGIPPSEVQYINYHGTSTELNDRIETRAVKLAFNGHAYQLAGLVAEEPHRPPAGRVRRSRRGRHAAGHARRRRAAHHQRGRARSRVRPGLHALHRPPLADRARRGQLHRLRKQELGAGLETCVKTITRVKTIVRVVLIAAAFAAAGYFYPPLRLFAMKAVGRSPVCPLRNALAADRNLKLQIRYYDAILRASKVVEKDPAGYHLVRHAVRPVVDPRRRRLRAAVQPRRAGA